VDFSLGGSGVVKYAERAYSSSNLVRPVAVFAVDPPLDFERFYNSIVHQMNLSKAEFAKKEISYFVGGLRFTFQATPASNIRKYYEISPYSNSDTTFTAIKKLVNCPIMLITEPDILWQMENHHDDYYNLNSVDCAAAINVLKILGNRNAILVVTSGKGIRKKTGLRNPHSWSIADPAETMTWLTGF
jgi:hypothetical protein